MQRRRDYGSAPPLFLDRKKYREYNVLKYNDAWPARNPEAMG